MTPRNRCRNDEQGSVLIMALAFITIFGLSVAFILAQAQTNLLHTEVTRSKEQRNYSADAATEWAIQQVRLNSSLCSSPTSAPWTGPAAPTFNNGVTTAISCRTSSANPDLLSSRRFSVITTDTTPGVASITTQSGSGSQASLTLNGAVYNSGSIGLKSNTSLAVTGGNWYQRNTNCSAPAVTQPSNLALSSPYGLQCTSSAWTTYDPAPVIPAVPTGGQPVPDTTSKPGCTIYKPGHYTSFAPSGHVYLASGVYDFDNVGDVKIDTNTDVYAGTAGPATFATPGPCATDTDAGLTAATGAGSGALLLFDRNSSIDVVNNGIVEVTSRSTSPGSFPMSVMTLAGWTGDTQPQSANCTNDLPSGASSPTCVIRATAGSASFLAHGMIYAPNAPVSISTLNGYPMSLGGLVAKDVVLQASTNGAGGVVIQAPGGSNNPIRDIVITAQANSSGNPASTGTSKVEAVIETQSSDQAQFAVVKSWRAAGVS